MNKAILLVDDEAIILLSLRHELRAELGSGYRYEIALDAAEALSVFDDLSVDGFTVVLVVSDWLMPGMKGDEFLLCIHELHPEVKTIMVSGQTDEDQLERLRSAGALDAFFRKPWNAAKLVAECRSLLASYERA